MPYTPPPGSNVQILTELSASHAIPVVDLDRSDLHQDQFIYPGDIQPPADSGFVSPVYPSGAPEALSGTGDLGAINLTSAQTKIIVEAPGATATLAAADKAGLNKLIRLATSSSGDPCVITVTGAPFATITLEEPDSFIHLMWSNTGWFVMDSLGAVLA
jgi:hypothetical protein